MKLVALILSLGFYSTHSFVPTASFRKPVSLKLTREEVEQRLDELGDMLTRVDKTNEEMEAFEIAEGMIASVANFAQSEELVQRKKIASAHKALEEAMRDEEAFEELYNLVELEEKDFLNKMTKFHSANEEMTRWKLSIIHKYVETSLNEARQRIEAARQSEVSARRTLKTLDHWEREVEDIFVELEAMRQQRELEEWEERHRNTGKNSLENKGQGRGRKRTPLVSDANPCHSISQIHTMTKAILLLSFITSIDSFAFVRQTPRPLLATYAVKKDREVPDSWTQFSDRLKRIQETNDEWAAMNLAEDILRAAGDFAHDKEILEKEHFDSAHASLQKVILEEDTLEMMERKIHQEEDEFLEESMSGNYIDDDDSKLWAMSVVEDYLDSRLRIAHKKEEEIRKEEEEAKNTIENLEKWEHEIDDTLHMLEDLKHEKKLEELKTFEKDKTGGTGI